uniref:glucuronosyltransferase n=1 Tax=Ditylenchus dipsaci TaxID=166011 RepID=A0A915ET98_9BILA
MAYSHMQFQGKLADVLAEAGHEVHVLMLDIDPSLSNFNASYKVQRIIRVKRPAIRMIEMQKIDSLKRPFTPEYDHYEMWRNFMYFMETICEDLLENKDLLEHLKAEKYDTQLASLALQLHGMVGSVFGIPTMSSYVPNFLLPPKNMPMNFKERAYNFYADLAEYFTLKREPYIAMQFLFDEAFGVDFPSLKDIARNVSLVFVNANEFNSLAQPLSNKIVFIGGIVRLKPNALNEHLQVIFNKSNKGVVLCSFGSHPDTRSMSENLKKAFLATFSSFPDYDFILKWTLDQKNSSSFDAAPNVHVFDWLDQKAILNQPKLVAFMSHCGLNSLTEAANAGVPIVGCLYLVINSLMQL